MEEERFRELQLEVPDPEQHGPLRMLDTPSAPCVQAPGGGVHILCLSARLSCLTGHERP